MRHSSSSASQDPQDPQDPPPPFSRLPSWDVSTVTCDSGHDTTLTVPTVDAIAEAYPGVPIDTVSPRHL